MTIFFFNLEVVRAGEVERVGVEFTLPCIPK